MPIIKRNRLKKNRDDYMAVEKIRVATSIPSLRDKVKIKLGSDSDDVFWYIRFNIPLDEASVSPKTMEVTDTLGYIMRTDIAYDKDRNMIVISPVDSYEQNVYYLLNISKKVKSARGQNLRSKIHILFKLVGKQISEFKVLKKTVKVPAPKPRPKDYEKIAKTKLYSFDPAIFADVPRDRLPTSKLRANIMPAVIGLLLLCANIALRNDALWIAAVGLCALGAGVLFFQLRKPAQRSALVYNRGVRHFNKERYEKAADCFQRAAAFDEHNEMAEYALNKVRFYL